MQEMWLWSLGGKDPQRRDWQLTLAFLPEEFHGQRSLAGYIQSMGLQKRHNIATQHACIFCNIFFLKISICNWEGWRVWYPTGICFHASHRKWGGGGHPGLGSEHMFNFMKSLPCGLLCFPHFEIQREFEWRRWSGSSKQCLRLLNCGQTHKGDHRPAHYRCLIDKTPAPSHGTMRPSSWVY